MQEEAMPTDDAMPNDPPRPVVRFEPGFPALLSLLVPGLGQFYLGRRFAGVLWLLATTVGYVPFLLPGIVLHVLAVGTACFRTPKDLPKSA